MECCSLRLLREICKWFDSASSDRESRALPILVVIKLREMIVPAFDSLIKVTTKVSTMAVFIWSDIHTLL